MFGKKKAQPTESESIATLNASIKEAIAVARECDTSNPRSERKRVTTGFEERSGWISLWFEAAHTPSMISLVIQSMAYLNKFERIEDRLAKLELIVAEKRRPPSRLGATFRFLAENIETLREMVDEFREIRSATANQ
jgi:hypothetical protein